MPDIPRLIRRHRQAFHHFVEVWAECISDWKNQKSKRNEGCQPKCRLALGKSSAGERCGCLGGASQIDIRQRMDEFVTEYQYLIAGSGLDNQLIGSDENACAWGQFSILLECTVDIERRAFTFNVKPAVIRMFD